MSARLLATAFSEYLAGGLIAVTAIFANASPG